MANSWLTNNQMLADKQQTDRQTADKWLTVGQKTTTAGQQMTNSHPTVYGQFQQLSGENVGRQLAVCRSTVGDLLVICLQQPANTATRSQIMHSTVYGHLT